MCYWIILFLASCASLESPKETSFNGMFPSTNLNQYIKLRSPEYAPGLPDSNVIELTIENKSRDYIYFPNSFGIQIFSYSEEDNIWNEIPNKMNYLGNSVILHPKGERLLSGSGISFLPDMSGIYEHSTIRVVVVGNIVRDEVIAEERVGAYIDIELDD
jgi:hypothetical protein